MNSYPSWIQRIPEMLEALALADGERIDRQSVERLFDLRKTAACQLLKRMGAESAGHSLVISRSLLGERHKVGGLGRLGSEPRIPPSEYLIQLAIQHLGAGLQQQVRALQRPLHLLLLDEAAAHHLVGR